MCMYIYIYIYALLQLLPIPGACSGVDKVQFRAAQALAALCGAGGYGVEADPAMVRQALETALMPVGRTKTKQQTYALP